MKGWKIGLGVLVLFYVGALLAPFLAPYTPSQQFRQLAYAPPTGIHFRDHDGVWHLRPFIYSYHRLGLQTRYRAGAVRLPIYFFIQGPPYRWGGRSWRLHLFGLQDPARKIFLLGSDGLGRDQFSRILYASRVSLTIGPIGMLLAVILGTLLGLVAGYSSGWVDTLIMRGPDLFLALPAFFLILGLRALFPLQLSGGEIYWIVVLIFGLTGWAWITRVIRGQVLTLKEREYVLAARAMGATPMRILGRHILPFTLNPLLVQCTIFIPTFMLAEVTLSFLGVGVQEPDSSWGNLLTAGTSVQAITQFPWLLAPAAFIFLAVLSFNGIAEKLKPSREQRPFV